MELWLSFFVTFFFKQFSSVINRQTSFGKLENYSFSGVRFRLF